MLHNICLLGRIGKTRTIRIQPVPNELNLSKAITWIEDSHLLKEFHSCVLAIIFLLFIELVGNELSYCVPSEYKKTISVHLDRQGDFRCFKYTRSQRLAGNYYYLVGYNEKKALKLNVSNYVQNLTTCIARHFEEKTGTITFPTAAI